MVVLSNIAENDPIWFEKTIRTIVRDEIDRVMKKFEEALKNIDKRLAAIESELSNSPSTAKSTSAGSS